MVQVGVITEVIRPGASSAAPLSLLALIDRQQFVFSLPVSTCLSAKSRMSKCEGNCWRQ
jgi:hypothetical protein